MTYFGPDYQGDDSYDSFDALDSLSGFLYGAMAGLFLPAKTTSERIARWTALPCLVLPILGIVFLCYVPLAYWMQAVAVLVGLTMFCYAGWVGHVLERRYLRYEREIEEDPEIQLSDFRKRRRR
ncbi:hypothetical protein DTL42_08000 [Bremerella cremea]|uniref:Uncharacterized protein n=1 Tax=Bremerella cremea TaxID=1031537 RepID=A0A368KT58_9BACT|nr:hypothetical protein [Bremerella cremea]RCS52768.1 hypothetical protein DTL42_08000 [Bremerella cremea]